MASWLGVYPQLSLSFTIPCLDTLIPWRNTATMDTSPTALFDSYEQDYKQLIQSIDDRLASVKGDDGLKGGQCHLSWCYSNRPYIMLQRSESLH